MTYLILAIFILGYLAIALEHTMKINKAASALLIGVVCWAIYVVNLDQLLPSGAIPSWFLTEAAVQKVENIHQTFAIESQHLHLTGEIASILFFLMGAMTIVELVDAHVFKATTHLPPYMGMMLSLAVLWIVSELVSHTMDETTRSSTGVLAALRRVDMSSILFFLGILLAVGSLGAMGILESAARWLDETLPNREVVAVAIGLVSAVVDNVPLVAAGIEMYSMPINDDFWMLLAYCAGTGGSCLIIGSAAGVAAMGLEHIDFVWYLKKVAPLAVAGYIAGVFVILLQRLILH
ncbi:SLC13 family permease [Novipirellula rosea]|uniref:Citrate transporter-like domain-containing protein n=1 Tax=Novipirellula rosea TaxID=1031540 RepID=A0ABP8MR73_9BACT